MKCCSPSLKFLPSAVILQISNDMSTSGIQLNVTLLLFSAFTMKDIFCVYRIFIVSGSTSCITALPSTVSFDVLKMFADMFALSPMRRNLGIFGCIIIVFFAMASAVIMPLFIFLSCASPIKRHDVILSGNVNFILIFPFLSVNSDGQKKAVSLKFSRIGTLLFGIFVFLSISCVSSLLFSKVA